MFSKLIDIPIKSENWFYCSMILMEHELSFALNILKIGGV